jgi:hypothetical protein
MLHRADPVAMLVHIFTGGFVPHELFTRERMLTIGKARKLFFLDFASQSPLLREFAVPLAVYPVALGVVVRFARAGISASRP